MQRYTANYAVGHRTLVLVDGQNLKGSLWRLGKKLSIESFRIWAASFGQPEIHWFQGNHESAQRFFGSLRQCGVKLHTKEPKRLPSGAMKSDMDVDLTVFALMHASRFDTIVLVSGDGDFRELIQGLDRMGVRVVVVAGSEERGVELLGSTDNHDLLDLEDVAWEFCW